LRRRIVESDVAVNPLTVYTAGDAGVTLPTVINRVTPSYTSQALGARIQGSVLLSAVLTDGTVGDVTVLRSLDTTYGLDSQAVVAAKKWLLNPGTKDGMAVAVRVTAARIGLVALSGRREELI
jgi:TonB family protein